MDTQTKKNSINALKKLLDAYQSQLDAGVIVEIKTVIAGLENCDCSSGKPPPEDWRLRALQVFADALSVITNVSSLMK